MSEDWIVESWVLFGLPDHFHFLSIKPFFLVLVIDPSKKESLEAHLAE